MNGLERTVLSLSIFLAFRQYVKTSVHYSCKVHFALCITLCFIVYTVHYTVLYSCKACFTLCITLSFTVYTVHYTVHYTVALVQL